jgi:hypothetical protein
LIKILNDHRDKLWAKLEADIQARGRKKDSKFRLSGPWKRFVRNQDGFKVYAVDGKWVRNNLSVIFGHGGHGLVHEFIPMDEIWIGTHHYHENPWSECDCGKGKNAKVSKAYFDSCTAHEIAEHLEMKKGKPYWVAHQLAIEEERKLGLLPDSELKP